MYLICVYMYLQYASKRLLMIWFFICYCMTATLLSIHSHASFPQCLFLHLLLARNWSLWLLFCLQWSKRVSRLLTRQNITCSSLPSVIRTGLLTALSHCYSLAENTKAPLQRSRSRQNINAGSVAAKAPPARGAHHEPEDRPSAAQAKANACSESGRRFKHTAAHRHGQDREKVVDRETVKELEKETRIEAEPAAVQPSSTCSANGESDVEALLARLRALWDSPLTSGGMYVCKMIVHTLMQLKSYFQYSCTHKTKKRWLVVKRKCLRYEKTPKKHNRTLMTLRAVFLSLV